MTRKQQKQKLRHKCATMKLLHGSRRKKKQCINNDTHGKAFRGGRCRACWKVKLAAERAAYAEARQ
jgi:hypothetical protein